MFPFKFDLKKYPVNHHIRKNPQCTIYKLAGFTNFSQIHFNMTNNGTAYSRDYANKELIPIPGN